MEVSLTLREKYIATIGLEIHIQLLTKSKMFSSDPAEYGALPNTNISTITLAHPGTLPMVNKEAINCAIKMGLACHSSITHTNFFSRKSYFYPDLPKGYQITQDTTPICRGGYIVITNEIGEEQQIQINRIHLEEDSGKLIHGMVEGVTLLDFNRAGIPLIELVTEPVLHSSETAYKVLSEVRKLVRYLEISDGNMEEGSLRCDTNISVMRIESNNFGPKVEIKNINSIRNVSLAIEHEIDRQIAIVNEGGTVIGETRSFQVDTKQTVSIRTKETARDYRYFPEPDLPPIVVSEEWIESIRTTMTLLPREYFKKFTTMYHITPYAAAVLTEQKDIAVFFESLCQQTSYYTAAANWIIGPIKSYLNTMSFSIQTFPIQPTHLAKLIEIVEKKYISFSTAAGQLFPSLLMEPDQDPLLLAKKLNLLHDHNLTSLQLLVEEVILDYPDKVLAYKKGKKGLLAMLMGEVMKRSNKKSDPHLASNLLKSKLDLL